MKLSQTIELVQSSPSSLFSKQDVLDILSKVQVSETVEITQNHIEDVAAEVRDRICRSGSDLVTIESITVSSGRYGSAIDDVDVTLADDEIEDIVKEVLVEMFAPAEEVSSSPENNTPENQLVTNSL